MPWFSAARIGGHLKLTFMVHYLEGIPNSVRTVVHAWWGITGACAPIWRAILE